MNGEICPQKVGDEPMMGKMLTSDDYDLYEMPEAGKNRMENELSKITFGVYCMIGKYESLMS